MLAQFEQGAWLNRLPAIGLAVWATLLLFAPSVRPDWSVAAVGDARRRLPASASCSRASMMPIEALPAASWHVALGLGFVSAVFDNIPLTALALRQGGYDWGFLAYAVGFGGSMIWFGSSAGVALASQFPQARSVKAWVRARLARRRRLRARLSSSCCSSSAGIPIRRDRPEAIAPAGASYLLFEVLSVGRVFPVRPDVPLALVPLAPVDELPVAALPLPAEPLPLLPPRPLLPALLLPPVLLPLAPPLMPVLPVESLAPTMLPPVPAVPLLPLRPLLPLSRLFHRQRCCRPSCRLRRSTRRCPSQHRTAQRGCGCCASC